MRNPIDNISRLQTQLNDLQLENQILKNILDSAGISYRQELMRLRTTDDLCDYDPDQGCTMLEHRELSVPNSISAKTLVDMDKAIENFRDGNVSNAIDLSDFSWRFDM